MVSYPTRSKIEWTCFKSCFFPFGEEQGIFAANASHILNSSNFHPIKRSRSHGAVGAADFNQGNAQIQLAVKDSIPTREGTLECFLKA